MCMLYVCVCEGEGESDVSGSLAAVCVGHDGLRCLVGSAL